MAIKKKNLEEALRHLQKLCRLSTKTNSSNSYNVLVVDVSESALNLMIQQIKANIFDVDF